MTKYNSLKTSLSGPHGLKMKRNGRDDMKLKDILKNAWIFALAKLPQNLVFLIIIAGVHGLLLYYVPVAWLVLMPLFLITWTSYTMNYYSWHVITKYMMPEDENKTETVFSDNIKEK